MLFNPPSAGFRSYSAGLTGVRSDTMWCRVGGDGDGYGTRAVGFGRSKTEVFEEDSNPLQRIPLTRSDFFFLIYEYVWGFFKMDGFGVWILYALPVLCLKVDGSGILRVFLVLYYK